MKKFINNKDNHVKVILSNFFGIDILFILNPNISNKTYQIIHLVLNIYLLTLKKSNGLNLGKGMR